VLLCAQRINGYVYCRLQVVVRSAEKVTAGLSSGAESTQQGEGTAGAHSSPVPTAGGEEQHGPVLGHLPACISEVLAPLMDAGSITTVAELGPAGSGSQTPHVLTKQGSGSLTRQGSGGLTRQGSGEGGPSTLPLLLHLRPTCLTEGGGNSPWSGRSPPSKSPHKRSGSNSANKHAVPPELEQRLSHLTQTAQQYLAGRDTGKVLREVRLHNARFS
jgi:hypothetical protein